MDYKVHVCQDKQGYQAFYFECLLEKISTTLICCGTDSRKTASLNCGILLLICTKLVLNHDAGSGNVSCYYFHVCCFLKLVLQK